MQEAFCVFDLFFHMQFAMRLRCDLGDQSILKSSTVEVAIEHTIEQSIY
jgi:hypothetical protein